MALITIVKKMSFLPTAFSTHLLNIQPVVAMTPLRTYIKNFDNDKTAILPTLGWMHQNRARQGYRTKKSKREYFPTYSEAKRVRAFGYDKKMSTEGGRKMIMKRILMNEAYLSQ